MGDRDTRRARRAMTVAGCLLMTCVGAGLGYQTRSLYTIPITEELGLSRSLYASAFSVVSLVSLAFTVNLGRIQKRLGGYRRLVLLAFGMHVAALFTASLGKSLWVYYLTTLLTVLGWHFCTTVPVTGLIDGWFDRGKGFWTGLIFAGSGLGGSLFSALTGRWIEDWGWRWSYRASALVVAGAGFLILFLVRDPPEGKSSAAAPAAVAAGGRGALKHRDFWLVGFSMMLLSVSLQGITINAPTILFDAGNSTALAAEVTGLMLLVSALSKILMGLVNDRFGVRVMRTLTLACGILGEGCLIFASRRWALYAYAVLFGLGFASALLFMPLHLAALFPGWSKSSILGYWSAFVGVGSAIGSPLCNLFYEAVGNYTAVILLSMGILALIWCLLEATGRDSAARKEKGRTA